MGALNDSALLIEVGNIWAGADAGSLVDLGAVRNVRFMAEQIKTQVKSDNRGTIINKIRMNGKLSFDWLEPADIDNLEILFKGVVTKGSVAGSIVNNYSQVVASGDWLYDVFIPFDHQDADGTYPNVDSVTLGTDGAIVLNTDYHKVQDPATGQWGIIIRDTGTVTTQAQTVTIQFDYTPAASKTLTGGKNQTATNRYVRIIGPSEDDAAVTRQIDLPSCICISDMILPFVDVENANDVGVMPVMIEMNKGEEWTYTDEINAA